MARALIFGILIADYLLKFWANSVKFQCGPLQFLAFFLTLKPISKIFRKLFELYIVNLSFF